LPAQTPIAKSFITPERKQRQRAIETRIGVFVDRQRHVEFDERAFEIIAMEAIDAGIDVLRGDIGLEQIDHQIISHQRQLSRTRATSLRRA